MLVLSFTINSFATNRKTLKVGETYNFTCNYNQAVDNLDLFLTGNAIAVEYKSYYGAGTRVSVEVTAITPEYASFTGRTIDECWIFHVVGVIDIKIPNNVLLSLGESYTYAPIITDAEATTTLTWTSSNSDVATINYSGVVTTVGIGQTTITCTATNGVSAQSIVTVSPVLAQEASLDKQECELSVDGSMQLTSTISPENVTSTKVKWLSSNENVAQVDDTGNVTAIAPGYCSIYSIADDGSRKYDKCLFHVLGNGTNPSIRNLLPRQFRCVLLHVFLVFRDTSFHLFDILSWWKFLWLDAALS